jgi:hypothetical protein
LSEIGYSGSQRPKPGKESKKSKIKNFSGSGSIYALIDGDRD